MDLIIWGPIDPCMNTGCDEYLVITVREDAIVRDHKYESCNTGDWTGQLSAE